MKPPMNTEQPSRNQIKKPITCTCTSMTTCTYFVDVDVHVLVDGCCHLQICLQKVKDFRPSNTNQTRRDGDTEKSTSVSPCLCGYHLSFVIFQEPARRPALPG